MSRILVTVLVLWTAILGGSPAHSIGYLSPDDSPASDSARWNSLGPARFDSISTADGLSDHAVHAILQDNRGFMWFGTSNGLTRYDGYEFSVYRHDSSDPSSLIHDTVLTLHEAGNGALWVGTLGGLDQLDPATGVFSHIQHLSNRAILTLHEDSEGTLWVGTTMGLTHFDLDHPEPAYFVRDSSTDRESPRRLSGDVVQALHEDRSGSLWIGTSPGFSGARGGLDQLDRSTDLFSHYPPNEGNMTNADFAGVGAIVEDDRGNLWVGTDGGLLRRDSASQSFIRYPLQDPYEDGMSSEVIRAILNDRKGHLWVGTLEGVYQLALGDDEHPSMSATHISHHSHDPHDPDSLANNTINVLYEDRSGVLWIGTNEGISKYDNIASRFILYENLPGDSNSISDNTVLAVCEDRDDILWIGTALGGLNRVDRASGTVTVYRHDPEDPASLKADTVTAIYEDRDGTLWVATANRWLEQFDGKTGTFVHAQYLSAGIPLLIIEDPSGALWIGTDYGLYRWNRTADSLRYYSGNGAPHSLSAFRVTDLWLDYQGSLLVGTQGGGIDVWDPGREDFFRHHHNPEEPDSLSHDTVLAIYEDPKGDDLWIGTWAGLDRLNRSTGRVSHFGADSDLGGNPVISIQADDRGFLWLGTLSGIYRFDPRTETFRRYDSHDGLQGGRFIHGATFRSDEGEMFIGGTQGLNAFHPNEIPDNPHPPPVIITAVSLFNKVVRKDPPANEHIEFAYHDNFLSFEFTALDYTSPSKNRYAYMMEGVDSQWVEAGTRRRADYPNLDPGAYTFRVKGSNNDGVWNEAGVALYIAITPPFWMTVWFRAIAILLVVSCIVGGVWLRMRSLSARSVDLERQVSARTMDLSEANERLLREMADRQRAEEDLAEQRSVAAVLAERNRLAQDLHDSVSQSLYGVTLYSEVASQLLETGELDQVAHHLEELKGMSLEALGEMRLLVFELRPPLLEEEGLQHALQARLEAVENRVGLRTSIDARGDVNLSIEAQEGLYRIVQEALNNVLKHAHANHVGLSLRSDTERGTVVLEVVDDGVGFDMGTARRSGGMGLQGMKERATALKGQLEVRSSEGKGTTVRVEVPQ